MTRRVSITAPQFGSDPSHLTAAARFADQADIRAIYAFDHLIPLGRPTGPMFDLSSSLGLLAATAGRATIGSMVLRITARPVGDSLALARTAAMLAPGRVVIGLGVGDSLTGEEHRRFGLDTPPFPERVAMLETFCNEFGGPVVIGGNHPHSARRASRLADGWNAWDPDLEEFRRLAGSVKADRPAFAVSVGLSVLLGRDLEEAQQLVATRRPGSRVRVSGPEGLAETCLRYFDAGADEMILTLVPNRPDRWEVLAESVLPRLA